jgi:hypothetical protein
MKMKSMILLFLAMSLSFVADYSFLMVPAVSSVGLPLNPNAASELTASTVDAAQNSNFININGNLIVSGNNVTVFAGLSSSQPVRVYLDGNVTVVDNGTLVLRHAVLYLVGAKGPYNRCIRLSSSSKGHPRLDLLNATVDAYTSNYGAAIYAYNDSEIVGTDFSFYRQRISPTLPSLGGETAIMCYDESSVNITECKVDLVLAYGDSRVFISSGSGPKRGGGSSPLDSSIGFECYNSSTVNLYAVAFGNAVVSDKAHLLLTYCTELSVGTITTTGQSRVDIFAGTTLNFPLTLSGYSYVSLSSSTISFTLFRMSVYLYDHATFAVVNDCSLGGVIEAFDYSRALLNNTNRLNGFANIAIECHDFSSVSTFNSSFYSGPFSVQIGLFDSSRLSLIKSFVYDGWITVSNDSVIYLSHSFLSDCRLVCQDNADAIIADRSFIADSVEMRGNTGLDVESSTLASIHCADSSNASFVGASVSELRVSDGSRVYVRNSTLKELSFSSSNVSGSFAGLTSFLKNLTLEGSSSLVSLLNATVNNLDFSLSGYSNVTISNSTISNLSLQGSSVVTLDNVTVSGSEYVLGDSSILEYSPLRVRSVDYFGNPLDGSVVTIGTGYTGTNVLQRRTADKDGWASFFIFSELENATGSFSVGIVTVSGSFRGVSASQFVNLASVRDVTLSFPLPAWSTFILPAVVLVAIVALLVVGYYALRRIRGRKEYLPV